MHKFILSEDAGSFARIVPHYPGAIPHLGRTCRPYQHPTPTARCEGSRFDFRYNTLRVRGRVEDTEGTPLERADVLVVLSNPSRVASRRLQTAADGSYEVPFVTGLRDHEVQAVASMNGFTITPVGAYASSSDPSQGFTLMHRLGTPHLNIFQIPNFLAPSARDARNRSSNIVKLLLKNVGTTPLRYNLVKKAADTWSTTATRRLPPRSATYPSLVDGNVFYAGDSLWAFDVSAEHNGVYRLDPRTFEVRKFMPLQLPANHSPHLLAFGMNRLWVLSVDGPCKNVTSLLKVNVESGEVEANDSMYRRGYPVGTSLDWTDDGLVLVTHKDGRRVHERDGFFWEPLGLAMRPLSSGRALWNGASLSIPLDGSTETATLENTSTGVVFKNLSALPVGRTPILVSVR